MITRPTSEQLVRVVRAELTEHVKTKIENPAVLESLGMVDALLAMVERRVDGEAAWMREEIAAIERAAAEIVGTDDDRDGRVGAGLADLRAARETESEPAMESGLETESEPAMEILRREYSAAGEVLSRCLEAVLPVGGERRQRFEEILRTRLAREVLIRGEFSLVGRD
jgi:hypothetical protein